MSLLFLYSQEQKWNLLNEVKNLEVFFYFLIFCYLVIVVVRDDDDPIFFNGDLKKIQRFSLKVFF